MKHSFLAKVKDGELIISRKSDYKEFLSELEGKECSVSISKQRTERSISQNRYLHALFTIYRDELNKLGNHFTSEQVKELCKAKFATIDVVNEATGEIIGQRIKGTSEMTKTELSEFVEQIIIWSASMFGIILPYPNENLILELE